MISYNGDPLELDEWLSSLSYGIYNYRNDLPSKLFVFSPQASTNVVDLFNSQQQYLDFIGNSDGSCYLIDTDNDGSVDLINFLILDEGWFDTRKGERSIIGDPLLPLVIVPTNNNSVPKSILGLETINPLEGYGVLRSTSGSKPITKEAPSDASTEQGSVILSNTKLNQASHYYRNNTPQEQSNEETAVRENKIGINQKLI